MILWSIIAIVLTVADQWIKVLVLNHIGLEDTVAFLPGVADLVFVKNTGAAFSIFHDKTWMLSVVSVVFCAAVIVFMVWKRPAHFLLRCSLGLMFAGALGNAIDRIFRGFVIDYIKLTFINFPIFNLADICITIGAVLLIIYALFFDKETVKKDR